MGLPRLIDDGISGKSSNLYVQDFFNLDHKFNQTAPFASENFDIIVSNPPWTALTSNSEASNLEPKEVNDRQWGAEYADTHGVPDRRPDQAYMLRARDFAADKARIGMIVGSRLFHQRSGKGGRWRNQFFKTNTLLTVIDLSDLVTGKLLFGGSKSPRLAGSVVVFSPEEPSLDNSFQLVAPKWYSGIRHRDEIVVTSADIRALSQQMVCEPGFWWKSASRGFPRDMRLLYRLNGVGHNGDNCLTILD